MAASAGNWDGTWPTDPEGDEDQWGGLISCARSILLSPFQVIPPGEVEPVG
jgi:hypothetical protein